MQYYRPCRNNEKQHNNVMPVETEVGLIKKVGYIICKEKGTYCNNNIQNGKQRIKIFFMYCDFGHIRSIGFILWVKNNELSLCETLFNPLFYEYLTKQRFLGM
jgi:hypothetical protein